MGWEFRCFWEAGPGDAAAAAALAAADGAEERTDVYVHTGLDAVGAKLRGGTRVLEVKFRMAHSRGAEKLRKRKVDAPGLEVAGAAAAAAAVLREPQVIEGTDGGTAADALADAAARLGPDSAVLGSSVPAPLVKLAKTRRACPVPEGTRSCLEVAHLAASVSYDAGATWAPAGHWTSACVEGAKPPKLLEEADACLATLPDSGPPDVLGGYPAFVRHVADKYR